MQDGGGNDGSSRRARHFTNRMRSLQRTQRSGSSGNHSISPRYSSSRDSTEGSHTDDDDNYDDAYSERYEDEEYSTSAFSHSHTSGDEGTDTDTAGSETLGEDSTAFSPAGRSREDESTIHSPYSQSSSNDDSDSTEVTSPVGHLSRAYTSSRSGSQDSRNASNRNEHLTISTSYSSDLQRKQKELDTLAPPDLSDRSTVSGSPNQRRRVPGGAAAKLMLIGPQQSDEDPRNREESETQEESIDAVASGEGEGQNEENAKEIDLQMQRAKAEFEKGSDDNRRYKVKTKTAASRSLIFMERRRERDTDSDVSTPSFLNRSEIFHDTAAAAVVALLRPREAQPGDSQSQVSNNNTNNDEISSVYSGTGGSIPKIRQAESNVVDNTSYESPLKQDVGHALISETTERRLESLQAKMKNPNATLTDLLTAIATPDNESVEMDMGYMVRRKNACGAIHVLTTETKSRIHICWTLGVLPALTSVLVDGGGAGEAALRLKFPDERIRHEYKLARNRAIATLMNLSMPKENRIAVFHTPSLVQAAISIILDDDEGTARRGCCTILAFLGKSPENRLLLAQVPGLLDALSKVLCPQHQLEEQDDVNASARRLQERPSTDASLASEPAAVTRRKKASSEQIGYDEAADEMLQVSRQNTFALLHHLIKEKDNAYHFARDYPFVWTLVEISKYFSSPSHVHAIKMLAHLTRHRLNTKTLVFQKRIVVPALVEAATKSPDGEARQFACFALQNFTQDKSCRQELATTENLIIALCDRARHATDSLERLAAVSALKNLCDEPANLIPMTNAPDGVSTLMHLAHDQEDGVTDVMQYRACDALATLSHWLRKIATSGQVLDAKNRGIQSPEGLCVPSLRVVTWNQWE